MVFHENGWNFNGSTINEATLKPLCLIAEQHFRLPTGRLYRYFARTEDSDLLRRFNGQYRGFYCHIPDGESWLPTYSFYCFLHRENADGTLEEELAFDDLVYIRHDTCLDPTGCVTTYAHELQHFVQHGFYPRLLRVNHILYNSLKRLEPTANASDVPFEREANIV